MKRYALLIVLLISFIGITGFVGNGTAGSNELAITFYETPLVCGAAPEIGCGSRAKPVLLALEKNPAIKEAWLNRPGTIIAVVWANRDQTKAVAKPIFDDYSLEFTKLSEKDATEYRKTFRRENLWYRGADVDALSREEATIIATSAVTFALENNLITKEEAENIRADIEAYFKEELVKIRTIEQLNEDSQNAFIQAMYSIAEKHIGEERAAKALELYHTNGGK